MRSSKGPIGVFDSGFGGLTVLKELQRQLPQYDYLYLGDNARAPYGSRSFPTIYRYTREAVGYLFDKGCPLVILACNTASAKALRSLQQKDLPISTDPTRRILGVIRPTVEALGEYTQTNHIGIVGTQGTISSNSYRLEIEHIHPHIKVSQQACPMWVPLVENNEINANIGTDYFIKRDLTSLLSQDQLIDTILLGCTHYPLLYERIKSQMPSNITIIRQGKIVATSLKDYLKRHPEMEERLTTNSNTDLYTTGERTDFLPLGSLFLDQELSYQDVEKAILAYRDEL